MSAAHGVVLDAGAFIALERRNPKMVHLASRLVRAKTPLVTSAGVVAQVWRGGDQAQVPIAFLLRHTVVVDITFPIARILGQLLGAARTKDPIAAHVAFLARQRGWPILTSDAGDMLAIDPTLTVESI